MTEDSDEDVGDFSFARHAMTTLGAAAAVLAGAAVVILLLKPGTGLGLLIVAIAVVGAIAAMAAVSRRTVRRAFGSDDPPA